ncbi:MAG: chemotaxis protein CheW [Pseudomonadota bacterium]
MSVSAVKTAANSDNDDGLSEENLEIIAPGSHSGTQQFITFTVDSEEYGIAITSVLEIKGWTETTRLPNQPEYLLGVLNLRGVIVPIMDLRFRFGIGKTEVSNTNVIIIVSIEDRYIGILVDAVSDILTVSQNDIQTVPNLDGSRRDHFLSGLVTIENRMVAILELVRLLEIASDLDELMSTTE